MNNSDRLYRIFAESLSLEPGMISDGLTYNTVPEWDSVGHMGLVAAIESGFDIMLDTDDIIDMSSVGKAKEILSKYEILF
jgi:acyl carrier protein